MPRFHITVTPDPDEPLIVTEERADAAQAWLESRVADGRFEMCLPFEQTGGFVLLEAPSRAAIGEMFADYPLLPTIDMRIDLVLPSLAAGFDVLRRAIGARERINA